MIKDLKTHWDLIYGTKPHEELGWFETDLSPTIDLIQKSNLKKDARILIAGAGSTTLVDHLVEEGYTNLIATDISTIALSRLEERVGPSNVEYIFDDLTESNEIVNQEQVDLWIDRAVLHFFIEEDYRDSYFDLIRTKIKSGGYVLLAEFSLSGANECSHLPVLRYNSKMLQEGLGSEFSLLECFEYDYFNPDGERRPYIYTLFRRH